MASLRESPEFQQGRSGERVVASHLQSKGWFIVPSYDYSGEDGNKAPRLEGALASYVIPDLDASRDGRRIWVEVKTKTAATFTRVTQQYEHGISERHFKSYKQVQEITGTDVWLVIYEENEGAILAAKLDDLPEPRKTRMKKHGMTQEPMVYFPRDAFKVLNA